MAGEKFTPDQVGTALLQTKGMVTLAAKMLNCDYNTVRNYIKRYPEVAQAAKDAKDATIDAVELKLYDNIMRGDTTAAIFYLKTQARDRGYIERIDLNVNIALVQETIKALTEAGYDATDFFTRAKAQAELKAAKAAKG